jgi:cytochrome c-type biogenesis protein CcmH
MAVLAPVVAVGIYMGLGSPGIPDQPFQARISAWKAADPARLEPPQLAAVLKDLTRQRPTDPQAFLYLALAQREAGNPTESVRAARRAVALSPQDAGLWEVLGESLMMEARGEISDAAQQAFREALKRDPGAVSSRFYLARSQVERGDRAAGLASLRKLSADLPGTDPRQRQLGMAIAEASEAPARVENAQLDMIRGMVAGLAARLEQSPDDPEGWVRLVRSYAVLGQTSDRDRALTQAKARYGSRPDILADLDAAARTERLK